MQYFVSKKSKQTKTPLRLTLNRGIQFVRTTLVYNMTDPRQSKNKHLMHKCLAIIYMIYHDSFTCKV